MGNSHRKQSCSRCGEAGHNRRRCPELLLPTERLLGKLGLIPVDERGLRQWHRNPEVTHEVMTLLKLSMEPVMGSRMWKFAWFNKPTEVLDFKRLLLRMLWHPHGEWIALWGIGAVSLIDVKTAVWPKRSLPDIENLMRKYARRLLGFHYGFSARKSSKDVEMRLAKFMDRVTSRGWSPLLDSSRWEEWIAMNEADSPEDEALVERRRGAV